MMYITKCISWLSLLILALNISTTYSASYRQLLYEANKAQCSLSGTMLIRYYKIDCPPKNAKLNVIIGPGNRTKLKCYNGYEEFNQLIPNMTIGVISNVEIRDCPLQESMHLSNIIQRLGIRNYKTLGLLNKFAANLSNYNFSDLYSLRNLTLKFNNVAHIPENVFADRSLKSLTSLDFYTNLQELPQNMLMHLKNLDFIALGNNLRNIPDDLFRFQTNLIDLQLSNNKLKNLSKEIFQYCTTLKSLNLENNQIEVLPSDVFEPLVNLFALNINGNKFTSLPDNLLMSNKNLIEFSLAHNQVPLTTLPSKFLADLPYLNFVTLQCNLDNVPANLFKNSTDITKITMSYNNLIDLPDLLFESQIKLVDLDLSYNNLTYFPSNLLETNKELLVFNASHNRLKNLTSLLFDECKKLEELILNDNELTTENIEITWIFRFQKSLKTFNLKNNSITHFGNEWFMPYFLEELNLSYNNITELNETDLTKLIIHNLKLDLSNNNIRTISLQASSSDDKYRINQLLQIDLNNNPISCDCKLLNFVKYFRGENEANHFMDHIQFSTRNIICIKPERFSGKLVKFLDPRELLCEQFDMCPKPCNCWIRSYDNIFIVDCSNMSLITVPELPIASELNVNGTELNLENNLITDLPLSHIPGYANVTKLSLAYNKLETIESSQIPVNLTHFDLRGNYLKTLSYNTLTFMNESKFLTEVYLSNNSWICDCEAKSLLSFTQNKIHLFKDFSNMTCANTPELTYFFDLPDLCPNENILLIVLGATTALICLVMASYYKYQIEIKIWLYAHNMCLGCVTEHELDKDKKYDAFISYSHKDEDFVIDSLVPELENGPIPFKLCVHYRDWLVGECIPDQIMKSIADSKKTIVILSASFIESVWAKMEFKAAHQAALTEGRAKVIVIIYDDIGEINNLDNDLQAYLKMNTYLKWGDPWFWKKLRYAMPHVKNIDKNFENISLQEIHRNLLK